MKNNRRYDLSSRLTHFFRHVDLLDDTAPCTPECWGYSNLVEDTDLSPLFLLRCAIRYGRLWATWAYRNKARTIYGPNPAICLTDMPTGAFLETSFVRQKRKQKISGYALTFQKPEMFRIGARPVIYGLSKSSSKIPSGKNGGLRILPKDLLPIHEQYRYVTYAPTTGRWNIDWTHEREWRWPMKDKASLQEFNRKIKEEYVVSSAREIPGLDLYSEKLSRIGVIVATKEEALRVFHDILVLVDRGDASSHAFEYVLASNDIPDPKKIRDPDEEADALADAAIDLSTYLAETPSADAELVQQVDDCIFNVNANSPVPKSGERGGCWLWILDNLHDVTRALLRSDRLVINQEGKYLLRLPEFDMRRSLRQREDMAEDLAKRLGDKFNLESGYYSVLNSTDPNAYPYYNGDFSHNLSFYNNYFDGL